jgi:hypothetical protein
MVFSLISQSCHSLSCSHDQYLYFDLSSNNFFLFNISIVFLKKNTKYVWLNCDVLFFLCKRFKKLKQFLKNNGRLFSIFCFLCIEYHVILLLPRYHLFYFCSLQNYHFCQLDIKWGWSNFKSIIIIIRCEFFTRYNLIWIVIVQLLFCSSEKIGGFVPRVI